MPPSDETDSKAFTTIGVSPQLRNQLREVRDSAGYDSYERLLVAMERNFEPDARDGDTTK